MTLRKNAKLLVMKIAGSYVEFAERLPLPEFQGMPKNLLIREHLREGFESANADKIFESTYDEQVKKAVNCS